MATLNTPVQDLPYPDENSKINSTDEYIRNLAFALETKLVMSFPSSVERAAEIPTPTEGMVAWLQGSNKLTLYNGTAWVQIYPTVPTITSGTAAPAAGSGAVGDIYIQYT